MEITKVDFVGIPTQDMQRAARFYVETLGLRRDAESDTEFWAGDTCFSLWKPEWAGHSWAPSRTGLIALHVADVSAARTDLEQRGVDFEGDIVDTGVCHMAFFSDPDGNSLMLHHNYKRSSHGED